jgi:hypothetical protein
MSDWTQDNIVDDPSAYLLGNCMSDAEKDTDAIEKENRFLPVPPGEQLLVIAGFFGPPKSFYHKVWLNGVPTGFEASVVAVKLALASNPRATLSDRFTLPPRSPDGIKAYFHGVPAVTQGPDEGKPSKMQAGILGNRFQHFINRIGFPWGPGQPFPLEAQNMLGWRGRMVLCDIKKGDGTYKTKDGIEKPRDNSVAWFTYKPAPAGSVAVTAAPSGGPAAGAEFIRPNPAANAALAVATLAASDVI